LKKLKNKLKIMRDKKVRKPRTNNKGLLKKNRGYKTTSDMSGTSRKDIRKMERKATGRTAIGTLITKGARALKSASVKGLTNLANKYAKKRKDKLTKKINALGTGMSARKRRLIKRKKKY
tara:strand:- start:17 stop:376 length:360 start_codon:yes stop_codon:yes gene_type:complete